MKGLLIEDDPWKAEKIREYVETAFSEINLKVEASFKSGLTAIFNSAYDFILLDMSLSSYDQNKDNFAGKPKVFGGSDILKEMRRYRKHSKVVVVTQYNEFDGGSISMVELDTALKEKYPELYEGYITYVAGRTEWKNRLKVFLDSLGK